MVVLAAAVVLAASGSGGAATIKISVSAAAPWSASVPVTKGEKLTITATGEINYCAGQARCRATPDGSLVGEAICGTPPMCGALIGRLNGGTPFLVGKSKEVVAALAGKLEFGVNDQPGLYSDNSGSFALTIQTSTTPTSTTPTTTGEATPPEVRAFDFTAKFATPGETITLGFSVKDASGRARVYVNLYGGGTPLKQQKTEGPATGLKQTWTLTLSPSLKGPLYFCVWASNAAGKRTAAFHACKWIPLLVPIGRVSNGCGGEGWDTVVKVENHFGNTGTYVEPAHYTQPGHHYVPAKRFTVNFVSACNLHDAGYGGQMVEDEINNRVVDYRSWTRKQVDDKFKADMGALCREQIPPSAAHARRACEANLRYWAVRKVGDYFFDADLMKSGTQTDGPRNND